MPLIAPNDPCPCESGKPARGCCVFGGTAQPREADTRPRGPFTGFAHPKCYAADLNDCAQAISGEHFLSANVLRELGDRTVFVRGFPWQKTPVQRVGIGALESNVLCERHNSTLSPLDTQAGRLFRGFRSIEEDLRAGVGDAGTRLFAGIDVERWLLKALMGIASAGAARTQSGEGLAWIPPELWSRILFGRASFPRSWGLYVNGRIGSEANLDPKNVSISPITTDGAVSGCVVRLAGFELVLAMSDVPRRRTGALDDDSVYRPNAVRFMEPTSATVRYVCFGWMAGLVGGEVQLEWRTPPNV